MSTHQHKCTLRANRSGPTNAGQIEDNFVREIRRRFKRLRGLVRRTVGYENDALNLTGESSDGLIEANAEERERFEFTTRPELINKFMRWFKEAIDDTILEPLGETESVENHWISQYIRNGYTAGFNQATGLLMQEGVSLSNPDNENITQRPIARRTLQDLYTRAFENLQDISQDMAQTIREELTEGFAEGENPRKIADRLTKEIRDIQKTRAETLARTEVINAHSTAQLDRYESVGVTVVAHEWDAANDSRTCPFCERLDGLRLSTSEVGDNAISWAIEASWKPQNWRLQPPAHPRCRCHLRPIPGASEPTQPLSVRVQSVFGDRADVLQ